MNVKTFSYHYFSDLLGLPVRREGETKPIGRLADMGARKAQPYPHVVSLEVRAGRGRLERVAWADVASLKDREIVVRSPSREAPAAHFFLRHDMLDNQVVDVHGAKVLRVNDIHMLSAEGQLILGHVEVGLLGILRRLRFEKPVTALLRWLLDYEVQEKFVSIRHVEVLSSTGPAGSVRISQPPTRLSEIHPAELADILEQLGAEERRVAFDALSIETAAETLEEAEPDMQRTLLAEQEPSKAADILEEMPAHEAASALRDLPDTEAQGIINRMETEAARHVRMILLHEEETAGSVMATTCFEARPQETARDVLARVRERASGVQVLTSIYVLDDDRRLIGVASLRDLFRAPPEAALESLMNRQVVQVTADTHFKEVAQLFVKYGFRNIPVVDGEGRLLGAMRLKDVLTNLAPEIRP